MFYFIVNVSENIIGYEIINSTTYGRVESDSQVGLTRCMAVQHGKAYENPNNFDNKFVTSVFLDQTPRGQLYATAGTKTNEILKQYKKTKNIMGGFLVVMFSINGNPKDSYKHIQTYESFDTLNRKEQTQHKQMIQFLKITQMICFANDVSDTLGKINDTLIFKFKMHALFLKGHWNIWQSQYITTLSKDIRKISLYFVYFFFIVVCCVLL